jgi:high-affinity Fe2+/Pb2+ permease
MSGWVNRVVPARVPAARVAAWSLGLLGVVVLLFLALTASGGVPDPTEVRPGSLGHGTVILDPGVLVLREGLEAILVLAAVVAGLRGSNAAMRRPVAAGAGVSLLATVVTWFVAIWVLGALGGGGLDVQAATGLLAVVVLMVVMNWFFSSCLLDGVDESPPSPPPGAAGWAFWLVATWGGRRLCASGVHGRVSRGL